MWPGWRVFPPPRFPTPSTTTRYVSGETKEKVYRAIAELGYTPDASARSFRTGKKEDRGIYRAGYLQ